MKNRKLAFSDVLWIYAMLWRATAFAMNSDLDNGSFYTSEIRSRTRNMYEMSDCGPSANGLSTSSSTFVEKPIRRDDSLQNIAIRYGVKVCSNTPRSIWYAGHKVSVKLRKIRGRGCVVGCRSEESKQSFVWSGLFCVNFYQDSDAERQHSRRIGSAGSCSDNV